EPGEEPDVETVLRRTRKALQAAGHSHRYSLTAFADSKLESLATRGYVLTCGEEGAVAATKSVIEQALFYRALLEAAQGQSQLNARLPDLASQVSEALTMPIEAEIVERIASARTIYWAGRNDGVAEELTLKTNEITRKSADFLEGTYAVHGIEEVMSDDEVLIWVDPYEQSEQKFQEILVEGVGLPVVAISHRPTIFPTIRIADGGDLSGFVQMAAGWNILVEVGLRLGIDVDKPERARKVGNEFVENVVA
ncbi:MAG: sugar isomerase, partial [Planctomycetes bacterium]|nr:sugar isomerase [Planctomycetota bacterium]